MSRLFCLLVLFISTTFAQDFLLFSTGSDLTNSYIFASGRNSILINTQLTISDTAKVVNTLRTQVVKDERTLTYILVTSDSPNSYLGLATVLQTFPNATVVATPGVATSIAAKSAAAIATLLSQNITDINVVVPPITPLKSNSLTVGSNVFTLTELYQVGADYSTAVWNPATGALFTNFIHNGFHPDLSYSVRNGAFPRYQQALRDLLLLPVQTVYPLVGSPISNYASLVTAVTNIVQYVENFKLAVAAPNTRAQARDTLVAKYPTLQGANFLTASINAVIPVCTPSCAGRTCGDDGCGGSCGPCAAPFTCNINGQCECKAQCNGKFCGDDGCGRTCGSCKFGTCSAGVCVCNPTCAPDSCGADGCGGVCKCGSGKVCTKGLTCVVPSGNTVGLDLNFKSIITTDSTCPN